MRLADLLQPGDVTMNFEAADIATAGSRLLSGALTRHQVSEPAIESITESMAVREAEASTICGTVALPHARDGRVGAIIAAVGVNAGGVVAGRGDPKIVIAFVSPDGHRDEHLRFLAETARLSRDPARVDRIVHAADPAAVIDAMR